jgi:hypothetical protein
VAGSPLLPKALRNEKGTPLKTTKGIPFPQFDYPGSKTSPFTGKPYTKAEAKDVHDKTHAQNLRIQRGSKLDSKSRAVSAAKKKNFWNRPLHGNKNVFASIKDSLQSNPAPKNPRYYNGKEWVLRDSPKDTPSRSGSNKAALSAAANRAIKRNSSRRT